jgi:glycosyltransferase involved in cell wall biosynthesis
LKIVQVCPRFLPYIGGIETHVHEISKRLAKKNEVYIYTTDPSGKLPKEEMMNNIKIMRFKSFAPNEAYYFSPKLYFALRKVRCDILHMHSSNALTSLLTNYAMKNSQFKKLIYTPHYQPIASSKFRGLITKIYDPIQANVFKRADKTICVSDYEVNLIHKKFNIPFEKLINIPNGINVEKFKNLPEYNNDNYFHILHVGRLEKYKRVQWVILALKEILKKYPDKKIKCVIVGKGPYENELKRLTHKLGLQDFVTFKSNLSYDQLIEEYCRCNVFVLPSKYEAFSIVTLEALACKKPVIVTNIGFLTELSKNNGYTIDSKEDLVKYLLMIIENGFEVNFDYSEYSWDSVTKQILKVYNK